MSSFALTPWRTLTETSRPESRTRRHDFKIFSSAARSSGSRTSDARGLRRIVDQPTKHARSNIAGAANQRTRFAPSFVGSSKTNSPVIPLQDPHSIRRSIHFDTRDTAALQTKRARAPQALGRQEFRSAPPTRQCLQSTTEQGRTTSFRSHRHRLSCRRANPHASVRE